MAWLLRQGEVLASLELTNSPHAARGLLDEKDRTGALLITSSKAAHFFGRRYPVDLAYLDENLVVLATKTLSPHRLARRRRGTRCVLQIRAGAFERWGLSEGDCLEVRD